MGQRVQCSKLLLGDDLIYCTTCSSEKELDKNLFSQTNATIIAPRIRV